MEGIGVLQGEGWLARGSLLFSKAANPCARRQYHSFSALYLESFIKEHFKHFQKWVSISVFILQGSGNAAWRGLHTQITLSLAVDCSNQIPFHFIPESFLKISGH